MIIHGPWPARKVGIMESAACAYAGAMIQIQAQRHAAEAVKRLADADLEIARRRYLELRP